MLIMFTIIKCELIIVSDSQKKMWHFHLKDYELLVEKLMQRSDCTVTGLPKFTKQVIIVIRNNSET